MQGCIVDGNTLKVERASGRASRLSTLGYSPVNGGWKAPFPDPYTGPECFDGRNKMVYSRAVARLCRGAGTFHGAVGRASRVSHVGRTATLKNTNVVVTPGDRRFVTEIWTSIRNGKRFRFT